MPGLRRVTSNGPDNLAYEHDKAKTTSKVGLDGRFNVQFHQTPQQLAKWFERFNDVFAEHADRPRHKIYRKSSASTLGDGTVYPSPKLNIAIHIVGSRGDVQPFIPIARLLMKEPYGHRVRICTHPVFKDFVEGNGVEFFSIGGDPEALMAYMVKNPGLLPSRESVKAGDIGKRRREMAEIINGAWRGCIEAGNGMGQPVSAAQVVDAKDLFIADAIIANPPSMAHIHCAEKLGIPLHMVFTMPWSPTRSFHHPLASMTYGDADKSVANYLSFMMMELLTWQGLGDIINKFRTQTLHLDPISPLWGHQLLPRMRVPYSYLWSQELIPRPPDWGSHISITGFSFLHQASSYEPPDDLTAFLEAGPPPIYIGFGSIVVDDPVALTNLIYDATRLANVRAIVSKGWGGVGAGKAPDNVYLIGNCPHDWLFQQVSCVVHHGGAGTTAAGIAAGCPTVVVPFFGDQPFWGQMISKAGAGPSPIAFKKMTAATLAESITYALKPEVKAAVQTMAEHIAEEDGASETAQNIQDRLQIDDMRCDVCPERLALWRHRQTGAHLSSFAVGCLLDAEVYTPRDFKLLRHRHWYVDEGAEHPLIGAIAAISGSFTALGTATSDFSSRLQHPPSHLAPPISPLSPTTLNSTPPSPSSLRRARFSTQAARLPPSQLHTVAKKWAKKSFQPSDLRGPPLIHPPTLTEKSLASLRALEHSPQHGRFFASVRTTGRYATDVVKAGLKAHVAFWYNIANGFHNYPSYGWASEEVRRRREITGLGSGVWAAGEEVVLGVYDAVSGVVVKPYRGATTDGIRGLGRGVMGAGRGLVCNVGAAVFGIGGYTLKGVEREAGKRRKTKLRAEVLLIRLRMAIEEFEGAAEEERRVVLERWERLRKEERGGRGLGR